MTPGSNASAVALYRSSGFAIIRQQIALRRPD